MTFAIYNLTDNTWVIDPATLEIWTTKDPYIGAAMLNKQQSKIAEPKLDYELRRYNDKKTERK